MTSDEANAALGTSANNHQPARWLPTFRASPCSSIECSLEPHLARRSAHRRHLPWAVCNARASLAPRHCPSVTRKTSCDRLTEQRTKRAGISTKVDPLATQTTLKTALVALDNSRRKAGVPKKGVAKAVQTRQDPGQGETVIDAPISGSCTSSLGPGGGLDHGRQGEQMPPAAGAPAGHGVRRGPGRGSGHRQVGGAGGLGDEAVREREW